MYLDLMELNMSFISPGLYTGSVLMPRDSLLQRRCGSRSAHALLCLSQLLGQLMIIHPGLISHSPRSSNPTHSSCRSKQSLTASRGLPSGLAYFGTITSILPSAGYSESSSRTTDPSGVVIEPPLEVQVPSAPAVQVLPSFAPTLSDALNDSSAVRTVNFMTAGDK